MIHLNEKEKAVLHEVAAAMVSGDVYETTAATKIEFAVMYLQNVLVHGDMVQELRALGEKATAA